jgi:hypothetical protein
MSRGKRKQLKGDYIKSSTDINRIQIALQNGGKFEIIELWQKVEYWFNHIEGGREKVTKSIYNKLSI